jgi:hypothetical protein
MTKITILLVMTILLSGCGLMNSKYIYWNPPCRTVVTASVGASMIQGEEVCKNDVYNTVRSSFSQQLIYSGKTGSTIRIAYREFSSNLARPAFYQELTYDLSESKILTFRSTKIEVISATNSEITFSILENPWCGRSGEKIGGC